jgi:septal ring factor EnvC (AmiA/AmiB activator)
MLEYNSELTVFLCYNPYGSARSTWCQPGDYDSAAKSLTTRKNELAKEKLAREKAQADAESLSRAVEEIKKIADQLVAHVPSLETQVKNLNDKIIDLNIDLQARELSLEQTTAAKDDFQRQNT